MEKDAGRVRLWIQVEGRMFVDRLVSREKKVRKHDGEVG